jgi:hypothetical protein
MLARSRTRMLGQGPWDAGRLQGGSQGDHIRARAYPGEGLPGPRWNAEKSPRAWARVPAPFAIGYLPLAARRSRQGAWINAKVSAEPPYLGGERHARGSAVFCRSNLHTTTSSEKSRILRLLTTGTLPSDRA